MGDLVAFLRARLDEDERIARRTEADPAAPDWACWDSLTALWPAIDEVAISATPARVLREVEAKRRILDYHAREHDCPVSVPASFEYISTEYVGSEETCSTLRALAAVWSDHPDYDKEWA